MAFCREQNERRRHRHRRRRHTDTPKTQIKSYEKHLTTEWYRLKQTPKHIHTHTHLNWNIHWIFLPFLAACCACDRNINSYSIFNIMSSYLLVSHIKDSFSCVVQVNQCGLEHTIHFISQLNGIHRVCFEYVFNLFQRWRKKKKSKSSKTFTVGLFYGIQEINYLRIFRFISCCGPVLPTVEESNKI